MIIDFHTHVFPDRIAEATIRALSERSCIRPSTDGTAGGLARSMENAGVSLSVNLPVLTRPEQTERVNEGLLARMDEMRGMGILSFAGMHPGYEKYKEKLREFSSLGVKGIKLHPAYQGTDLDDPAMMRIIGDACECGLIVLVHTGLDIGIPGHNYADVRMILRVLEEVKPDRLVLAHMGGWQAWEEVGRDLAGADVWLDTAFSFGRIDTTDHSELHNMAPEAFLSLCRSHGTDRILFATDSPWAGQKTYVDTIRSLPFTQEERAAILGGNAVKLLGL